MPAEINLDDVTTFFFLIIKYIVNLLCLSIRLREILLTDNNPVSGKEKRNLNYLCLENVK